MAAIKKSLSLRTQLISGIVITTVAAIGLIGVISIAMLENAVKSGKVREAWRTARVVRAGLDNVRPSSGAGADYIKNVFKDTGITVFTLGDSSGKTSYREGSLPADKGERLLFEDGIEVYAAGWGLFKPEPASLYVKFDGAPLRAAFLLPAADVSSYISPMRRFILFYAVIDSVIIIALGAYFLSVFIIGPVKRLEAAASRIAKGDLSVRIHVKGDGELATLSTAFNTMADRVAEEIKRLERVNKELLEAREEILKTSTLAAVGSLAAGMAHEIGNPLGAVSGYLDILRKGAKDAEGIMPMREGIMPMREGIMPKEEEKEILERMDREISRINEMVKEFLTLARPPLKASPSDVNTIARETCELISHNKEFTRIRHALDLKDGLPPVMIDEGKLKQVFMNILINAAHAIGGEGVITISTGLVKRARVAETMRRKGDMVFVAGEPLNEKEYVMISFKDTGCGMARDELSRIFDPFWTTKETGRGAGLGLFVSQSIINACGGDIEAESEAGEGSVFTVVLPVYSAGEKNENIGH